MVHIHQARFLKTPFNRNDDHFYTDLRHISLQQLGGFQWARVPCLRAGRYPELQRQVFSAQRFKLFACFAGLYSVILASPSYAHEARGKIEAAVSAVP